MVFFKSFRLIFYSFYLVIVSESSYSIFRFIFALVIITYFLIFSVLDLGKIEQLKDNWATSEYSVQLIRNKVF